MRRFVRLCLCAVVGAGALACTEDNENAQPDMAGDMGADMRVDPDDGVPPDMRVDPDDGVPPDMRVDPDDGVPPDMRVDPDDGVPPDMRVDPDDGVPPDMGGGDMGECVPDGPETCDGVDNDCNGEVDDVPGLGDDCAVGVGACRAMGTTVCGDGPDPVCDAVAGEPQDEICDNGVDDNCDGEFDEAMCLTLCEDDGDCDGGTVCDEGRCRPPEICDNGQDDDGDGAIDCVDSSCAMDPDCTRETGCGPGRIVQPGAYRATLEGDSAVDFARCTFPQDDATGPEAVFVFEPQAAGRYCADTRGSGIDTVVTLRRDPCDAADAEVACNDDADEFDPGAMLGFDGVAGSTHYIVVDSFEGTAGEIRLDLRAGDCDAPMGAEVCDSGQDDDGDGAVDCDDLDCAGDPRCEDPALCEMAMPIDFGRTRGELDGMSSTSLASCAQPRDAAAGPDRAYAFMVAEDATVCVDTRGSMVDTVLTVRTVACDVAAGEVACSDDGRGGFSFESELEFDADAGETYYVVVDSYAGDSGPFVVNIRPGGCDQPPAEICGDGEDNDDDTEVDCDDGDCLGTEMCPFADDEDCNNNRDDDGNGQADCDDLACLLDDACSLFADREDCGDRIDNDGDGAIDCRDLECARAPACR